MGAGIGEHTFAVHRHLDLRAAIRSCKPWLKSNGVVNAIVGGWQLNGTVIYQMGFPLLIYQQNLNSVIGAGVQRPNATGTNPVTSGSLEERMNNYINPAAFSQAPAFTFGDVSRSIGMRGPGQANWDLSLFKDFKVRERFAGQFRCEALNAFNTPLFANPNTLYTPTSASLGKITYQANLPRQLQLGIRLSF